MKKKFNKEVFFLATSMIFSFGLGALFAIALPAVELETIVNTNIKVDGLLAIFGGKIIEEELTYNLNFNILSLIGYLLPIIGLVIGLLAFRKRSKLLYFLSGVICLIAAVLMFTEPVIFNFVNNFSDIINASLLSGPIIGGCASIIAGSIAIGCGVKINS